MYILAIETTGPYASCSILDIMTGEVIITKRSDNNMSHLSDLIPLIDRALTESSVKKEEIKYVAPSVGPGSFTGIRIGVSTARALAQSLGIKAIPVETLEAFLYKPLPKGVNESAIKVGIINARRNQVYGIIQGNLDGGAYMLTDILEVLVEDVVPFGYEIVFYGDGIDAYEDKIREVLDRYKAKYVFSDKELRYQDSESLSNLAYIMLNTGFTVSYDRLLPNYMREAEAETKLKAGELGICKLKQE